MRTKVYIYSCIFTNRHDRRCRKPVVQLHAALRSGNSRSRPSVVASQRPRSVIRPRHQPRRRHVERRIGRRAVQRRDAHRGDACRPRCGRSSSVTSAAARSSIGISATPSDTVQSIVEDGQRDPERHVVVVRRQRLQVGADLVGDVAGARDAVGADDHQIDLAVLHQMPAGIVGDHGVRARRAGRVPRRSARRPGCAGASRPPRHAGRCPRHAPCRSAPARCPNRPWPASRRCNGSARSPARPALPAAASISGSPCRPIASFCATSSSAIAAASA